MKRTYALITSFVMIMLCLCVVTKAQAAVVIVDPNPSVCHATSFPYCTIQAAVSAATSGDTIRISDGIYYEHDIVIDKELTIEAKNPGEVTIDAQRIDRIFTLTPASYFRSNPVTLSGLKLINGFARDVIGNGGAIYSVDVDLTIDQCEFSYNESPNDGGAIYIERVNDRDPSDAVYSSFDFDVLIQNSLFYSNVSTAWGGAIASNTTDNTTINVVNSTFYQNSAGIFGGAVANDGIMYLLSVTMLENYALDAGGIYDSGFHETHLQNSVLSNSSSNANPDCYHEITSDGYNIVSNLGSCLMSNSTDLTNVSVGRLYHFDVNGGFPSSIIFDAHSPVIDFVQSGCVDQDGISLTRDQRGLARPFNADRDAYSYCDAGAVEHQAIKQYRDSDGDGYGDPSISIRRAFAISGYVTNSDDCDDTVAGSPIIRYYQDADGDNYGISAVYVDSCAIQPGYTTNTGAFDCDDANNVINPGETEINDYVDNDCDGSVDEAI